MPVQVQVEGERRRNFRLMQRVLFHYACSKSDFFSSSFNPPFFFPLSLIIKAFPIHFQIKVSLAEDVVSLRSAGNLHDKARSPHPPIYE